MPSIMHACLWSKLNSVLEKDSSTPSVCITEHCSQWWCSKHERALPAIVTPSLDIDKWKCKTHEVKGNPFRLKKLFPTAFVWRNWPVKETLEIKILEGKKYTCNHGYTIQSLSKGLSICSKTFVMPKKMSSDSLLFKKNKLHINTCGFFVLPY